MKCGQMIERCLKPVKACFKPCRYAGRRPIEVTNWYATAYLKLELFSLLVLALLKYYNQTSGIPGGRPEFTNGAVVLWLVMSVGSLYMCMAAIKACSIRDWTLLFPFAVYQIFLMSQTLLYLIHYISDYSLVQVEMENSTILGQSTYVAESIHNANAKFLAVIWIILIFCVLFIRSFFICPIMDSLMVFFKSRKRVGPQAVLPRNLQESVEDDVEGGHVVESEEDGIEGEHVVENEENGIEGVHVVVSQPRDSEENGEGTVRVEVYKKAAGAESYSHHQLLNCGQLVSIKLEKPN